MAITGWEMWLAVGAGAALAALSEIRKHRRQHLGPWSRPARWAAVIGGVTWAVIFGVLLARPAGARWQQDFLRFVPVDEVGAPHTAKWLVEECAGDSGWTGSTILPGTLTATPVVQFVSANVTWQLNDATYAFRIRNTGRAITLTPTNATAAACVASDSDW